MPKAVKIGVSIFVFALVASLALIVWQKSQVQAPAPKSTTNNALTVKKVDLSSQPEWVRKLEVSAVKGVGRGERGLDNVKVIINNIPSGMVSSLTYTIAYTYKTKDGDASGGFFSSTPVSLDGATTFTRTFDFGTCSTKSCVRHTGVTAMDIEFDFTTSSGDQPIWSKTVELQ